MGGSGVPPLKPPEVQARGDDAACLFLGGCEELLHTPRESTPALP